MTTLTVSTRPPSSGEWMDPTKVDRSVLADDIGAAISRGVKEIRIGEVAREALGFDFPPGARIERVGVTWVFEPGLDGPTSVGHIPAGPWEFDRRVTDIFDDMLRRSIPQLDVMRSAVVEAASRFFTAPNARVVDIGCSRGRQLSALLGANPSWTAIGWDRSLPMVDAARGELERFGDRARVDLRDVVEDGLPGGEFDVALLVLTLQFIAPQKRLELLQRLRRRVKPGAVIVLVEKVDAGSRFIDAYHAMKHRNGYTDAEIVAKAESLRGVLVPWPARLCETALEEAGWGRPECFWRWFNFAGWVSEAV